jgi:hypothetical protein
MQSTSRVLRVIRQRLERDAAEWRQERRATARRA